MREYKIVKINLTTQESTPEQLVVITLEDVDTGKFHAVMFAENSNIGVEEANGIITLQLMSFPVVDNTKHNEIQAF